MFWLQEYSIVNLEKESLIKVTCLNRSCNVLRFIIERKHIVSFDKYAYLKGQTFHSYELLITTSILVIMRLTDFTCLCNDTCSIRLL